jgi:hypothetical protein
MAAIPKRTPLFDMIILVIIYAVSIVVVDPLGDFPLNDDWAFARPVLGLVEHGDWRPTNFSGMSLITQSLWGAIFCVPAGFSFNALRLSTLILAIVGILGVYLLFATNNSKRLVALTAAFTLGFNPIYYHLSNTFMTDVPFTTLTIFSSIFFARCIWRFGYLDLSIGCALGMAATLCRQLGLFLPLAFAVAIVMQRGFTKIWLCRAILPSIICMTALMLFEQWMRNTGRMPVNYGISGGYIADRSISIKAIAFRTETALLYLGLFCLPMLLLLSSSSARLNTNSAILRAVPTLSGGLFALFSIYLTFGLHKSRMPVPLPGNILIAQGLGALTIRGSYEQLPSLFWVIVSVLSVVGGVLLIRAMIASSIVLVRRIAISDMSERDFIQIFFLTAVGIYALPILVSGFFDRYLVSLVPSLLFLLYFNADWLVRKGVGPTIQKFASVIVIAIIAVFSVLGTRDYLTWNRIRWEALATFQETSGVSARDIGGGFEYKGWFLYDRESEWWVEDNKYEVSFSIIPGYKVIRSYAYTTWMPPRARMLFLLERDTRS